MSTRFVFVTLLSTALLGSCSSSHPESPRVVSAQPSAAPICAKSIQGDLNSALISVRLSDQNSTLVAVKTNTTGNVTECRIMKSGGSVQADKTSCDWVKDRWRSLERCQAS
jgi:hypothetical protein